MTLPSILALHWPLRNNRQTIQLQRACAVMVNIGLQYNLSFLSPPESTLLVVTIAISGEGSSGHAAARAEAAPARQAGRACRLSSLESAKRSEPRRNFWISLHWRRRRGVVLDDAVLQFRRPGAGAASFLPWTYGRTELREDNLAHNLLLHPAPRSSLLRSPFGACTHPSIPSFTPSTSLIL